MSQILYLGRMNFRCRSLLFFLSLSFKVFAQTEPVSADTFTTAIEDNSMFIEEAYNQEERVVQHISNFVFQPGVFSFAFTQEWPAHGLKHQLSYTFQYSLLDKGASQGFGDVLINYRYQLTYKESFAAFAPRLSVIIPTGSTAKGLGYGSCGLQTNLPFSKRWSNHWVTHLNAGLTWYYRVRMNEINFDHSLTSYFAGASVIYLCNEKFNLMLECLQTFNAVPEMNNGISYGNQTIVAPAFRFAINRKRVQIVPGLSVPFTLTPGSKAQAGALVYLSFEHGY